MLPSFQAWFRLPSGLSHGSSQALITGRFSDTDFPHGFLVAPSHREYWQGSIMAVFASGHIDRMQGIRASRRTGKKFQPVAIFPLLH